MVMESICLTMGSMMLFFFTVILFKSWKEQEKQQEKPPILFHRLTAPIQPMTEFHEGVYRATKEMNELPLCTGQFDTH